MLSANRKKKKKEQAEDEKEEDMLSLSKVPCFQHKAFLVFVEGAGSTIVAMISPQMGLEDFVEAAANQKRSVSRDFLSVLSGQSA